MRLPRLEHRRPQLRRFAMNAGAGRRHSETGFRRSSPPARRLRLIDAVPEGDTEAQERRSLLDGLRRTAVATLESLESIRHAARPALVFLICANFLGYAAVGSNGIFRLGGYRHLKNERMVELARLNSERTILAHHNALLDPRGADPDLVDQLLRSELGLVRPDEVIVPLHD